MDNLNETVDNLNEFDEKLDEFLHLYNIGENSGTDEEPGATVKPEPTGEPAINEEPKKFIEELRENTKNWKAVGLTRFIGKFKKNALEMSLKGNSAYSIIVPSVFYEGFTEWLKDEEFKFEEKVAKNENVKKVKVEW